MMPNKHDQKAMYVVSILPRVLCGNKFLYGKALFHAGENSSRTLSYISKKRHHVGLVCVVHVMYEGPIPKH